MIHVTCTLRNVYVISVVWLKWWVGGFSPSLLRCFLSMDAHAIHCSSLNQLLGTLLQIIVELANRFSIHLEPHPFPAFRGAQRGASSSGSFEVLQPDEDPPIPGPNGQLLEPPTCAYRCRFCQQPCSRLPNQHKHHSCFEHRHRR